MKLMGEIDFLAMFFKHFPRFVKGVYYTDIIRHNNYEVNRERRD